MGSSPAPMPQRPDGPRRLAPIAVYDSGIGGLSILHALLQELPEERYLYVADQAHAPYGERHLDQVAERALAVAQRAVHVYGAKALVVACNTATAAAIATLRQHFPSIPMVGVEPALRPALGVTRTRRVGVLATRGTLESAKFAQLLARVQPEAQFVLKAADGLADAIERDSTPEIVAISSSCTRAMGQFGTDGHAIDTLVLGCTHYPLAHTALRQAVGPAVQLLDAGAPVARQTRRLLEQLGLCAPEPVRAARLHFASTAPSARLTEGIRRWLPQECADVHAF